MQIHDLTQQTPNLNSQLIFDTGSATYKALVSDIAKCIIEQYAGSTIGGSAQTLAAAISNTYNLAKSPGTIANDTDLNTIVTHGHYAASNSAAASCVNCPVTRGFRLTVETGLTGTTNAWLRQTLIQGENGDTYTRHTTNTGATWTAWKKTNTDDANGPHFGTGTLSAGTLLSTDTDINQLLTGEYYWASASYRPSANIPDNTAVRGRLWALDSGGQDIYYAQILYTSNFNWFIRYCTSKSSYTWTEWKRINAGETEYTSLACSYGTLTYKCYKTGRIVSLIATIDVTSNIPANSDVITGLPFTGQTANYTPIRAFNNTTATYIDLDVHRSGSSACALSTRTAIASGASIRINATYMTE